MAAGNKKALWLALKHYDFGHLVPVHLRDHVDAVFGGAGASTRAFSDKLARKLGWSPSFALDAIEEYRKFLFLGMVATFPVTPSRVIDQVWHEHLLFSRGYREFCDRVLGRAFDHHPELVPSEDQTEAYSAQYQATLELYRAEFDRDAPEAFWGTPKFITGRRPAARPRPRKRSDDETVDAIFDDMPLHAHFDRDHLGHVSHPEFGHGTSGGAGGGAHWDGADAGHDGGASDGHCGGDGGGGDGGGCSSDCLGDP